MKSLIVYGSKYGFTGECAGILAKKISGKVDVINLEKEKVNNLNQYDNIIIGTSIYAGRIRKVVGKFCNENLDTLLTKRIGLFICCGQTEKAEEQLDMAYPEELKRHALAREHLGYEFNFNKMGFIDKKVVKMIAKIKENKREILEDNIDKLASFFN
ncbi:flavodoxin domain-containing protein [Thermohalobacter berrensis]|uniref:Flavodoxin domain-containing protein n=1 Tax=Thermohalobacter berrensis TaxID=99594 RepID=A0A419SZ15_9FIRM|nr:flavodoxin domain-containing protein [Thermohalobacter berrensis]RKD30507.1 hypothetical protein BET03_03995 [Thermohalobacter berrensis]